MIISGRTPLFSRHAFFLGLALGAGAVVYATTEAREEQPTLGASAAYLAAQHARAEYDLDQTNTYYHYTLAADPDNADLLREAYYHLALNGDYEAAGPLARRVSDMNDRLMFAPMVAAAHALKTEDLTAARTYLRRIPDARRPVTWQSMHAWSEADIRGYDVAKEILAPMIASDAYRGRGALTLATIAQYLGLNEDAALFYEHFFAHTSNVDLSIILVVHDFLKDQDNQERVGTLLAPFRERAKNSAVMAAFLEELEDPARPRFEMTPERGMALSLVQSARQLSGRAFEFSVLYARMAAYLMPELHSAHYVAADALAERDLYAPANLALARIPDDSSLKFGAELQYAMNLARMEELDASIALLERLAQDEPTRLEPRRFKGHVLMDARRFEEAVDAFDAAFDVLPDRMANSWTLHFNLGVALERSGQWPRAEENFKQALKLSPNQPVVLNYLGYSWLDRGEHFEEARSLIELAVKYSKEDDGSIIDSLGWAQFLAGEYEEAVKNLERAVELKPGDPTINAHLGDVYWQVGRRTEAMFQWQRAMSLDPEPKLQAELQKKLSGEDFALK